MILHIDMDAFYASVEERENPELVGKPVIVGGKPETRGVVAAANYEARRFGVHSAISAAAARRLCPQAIVLPPRMDFYAGIARQIRAIFARYTPLVEPLSLDEAFLDTGGSEHLFGKAEVIGRRIKDEIRNELRLVASVGVAPNKFLAKIASDLEKPDGMVVVVPGKEQQFLDPLPIGRLWGVGRVTGSVFERLGIATIGQLRALPQESLQDLAGRVGVRLWELAHGIDDRKVIPDRDAKTISHESTFASDITDQEMLRAWLLDLTEQVGRRLRRHELSGRTVHLKIRLADFQTVTRARTLPRPTNVTQELWEASAELLTRYAEGKKLSVRLLGMGVSGLQSDPRLQQQLFDNEDHQKQGQLDAVADAIQNRFGGAAIRRGSRLFRDNA
ncbi:MAG TPA: DNA polymerase IV [Pirellulales bacterium]|jgi:DNA polymerase-4